MRLEQRCRHGGKVVANAVISGSSADCIKTEFVFERVNFDSSEISEPGTEGELVTRNPSEMSFWFKDDDGDVCRFELSDGCLKFSTNDEIQEEDISKVAIIKGKIEIDGEKIWQMRPQYEEKMETYYQTLLKMVEARDPLEVRQNSEFEIFSSNLLPKRNCS